MGMGDLPRLGDCAASRREVAPALSEGLWACAVFPHVQRKHSTHRFPHVFPVAVPLAGDKRIMLDLALFFGYIQIESSPQIKNSLCHLGILTQNSIWQHRKQCYKCIELYIEINMHPLNSTILSRHHCARRSVDPDACASRGFPCVRLGRIQCSAPTQTNQGRL